MNTCMESCVNGRDNPIRFTHKLPFLVLRKGDLNLGLGNFQRWKSRIISFIYPPSENRNGRSETPLKEKHFIFEVRVHFV